MCRRVNVGDRRDLPLGPGPVGIPNRAVIAANGPALADRRAAVAGSVPGNGDVVAGRDADGW